MRISARDPSLRLKNGYALDDSGKKDAIDPRAMLEMKLRVWR
jgi:hypothetical protein